MPGCAEYLLSWLASHMSSSGSMLDMPDMSRMRASVQACKHLSVNRTASIGFPSGGRCTRLGGIRMSWC
jgi:hypothetical protein